MSNFFNIDDPSKYTCKIEHFTISHRILRVKIRGNESIGRKIYYAIFEGVKYHQGPIGWSGADFVVASREQHRQVFDMLKGRSIVEEMNTLYTVADVKPEILILAATARLVENL